MTKTHLIWLVGLSAIVAIASQMLGAELLFSIAKPVTTILIILLFLYRTSPMCGTRYTIIGALIACLGGDILLLDEKYFVYGLGSFLVAHLMFTWVFYSLANGKARYKPLVFLLLFGAGFYSLLLPKLGELAIPVAVYITCISIMCWQAINLSINLSNQAGYALVIAAMLFMFSDSIIAVDKFLIPFALSQAIILSTYWLSITIIACVFIGDKQFWRPNREAALN